MTTLTLTDVGRTYPAAVPVEALRTASIEIHQGDFVAIEGPSGAGKSTLLNILALLDQPTRGSYRIDDIDTAHLTNSHAAALRSTTFGFIFQSFHLLPRRSAVENVMLGMAYQGADPASARQRACQALAFVGLSQRADVPTEHLSGGERQRIAIARAICAQAPVIVADEPTGNLDTHSSRLIMDLLAQLNAEGTTVIVVTHDPTVAERADRRLHVVDGVVTEHLPDASRHRSDETDRTTPIPTPEAPATPPPYPSAAPDRGGKRAAERKRSSRLRPSMLWHDVAQAVTSDPSRSARLVAVVAIAVTLFLTVVSLSYTARYQVSDVFDAQLNRRVAVALTDPDSTGYIPRTVAQPDGEALTRIASIAGVKEAMIVSRHGDLAVSTDPHLRAQDLPLFGLTPATPLDELLTIRGGSLPLHRGQVLVGTAAASACGLGPLDASPTIWIQGTPYEVAGIITNAGIRSELLGGIVMAQDEAGGFQPPYDNILEIRTAPGAAAPISKVAALAWMPTHVENTVTEAPPDPRQMRDELESSVRTALLTLTIVSALAGLAVLSNAMDNSVQTRTGELALRRAMGATRNHLRALISAESVLIGLLGGAIASIASLLIVLGITIVQQWRPVIDPLSFPLGIATGVLTGLAAATLASRKAGRIQPGQALR